MTDLYDKGYGGASLGLWLRYYNDVDIVPLNNVTILQATPRDPLIRNRDGWYNVWACPNYMAIHPLKEPIEFHHLYNKNKISV